VYHLERMPMTKQRKRKVARAWAQIDALRKFIVRELMQRPVDYGVRKRAGVINTTGISA
jgi:hypothetical protein